MKRYLILYTVCSLLGNFGARSDMVWGTVHKDTPCSLSNLSQLLSMRTSVWYRVQYHTVEGAPSPIINLYSKGQNFPNLRDKCNTDMHGQLYNKDLAVPLIEIYRENFWCDSVKKKTGNCHNECGGKFHIPDFKQTSYLFSIGYKCGDTEGNLKGLEYKVTISDESKASCVDLTRKSSDKEQQSVINHCKLIYPYAALPNPLGNTDLQKATAEMKSRRDEVAEWLRRWIAVPMGSPRVGSNPSLVEFTFVNLPEDSEFNYDFLPPCPSNDVLVICLRITSCVALVVIVAVCIRPSYGRQGVLAKWLKTKRYLILHLLFSLFGTFEARRAYMVFGTIQGNTSWFFSDLSQVPAMRASIWYRVQYPIVEGAPTPVITFYFNGQNSTNLRERCNTDMHGQLHNKDLAIPLIEKYREDFWCWSVKKKTWNCHGNIQIQEFKPMSYLFSIGYKCGDTGET